METLLATRAMILGALADIVAGDLAAAKLELFENDIQPTPTTELTDYTPASYTGFATKAVTWGAPSVSDDGHPEVVGIATEFRPTGASAGKVAYGALLLETGGALRAAARFTDAPVSMATTADSVLVTVRLRLDPIGGFLVLIS